MEKHKEEERMCEKEKELCAQIPGSCTDNNTDAASGKLPFRKISQYICGFRCSWKGNFTVGYHTVLWTGKDYMEKSE